MTLVSVTAYQSFGGEVEASNTPTIRRLTPSCRHQRPRIALSRITDAMFREKHGIGRRCPTRARASNIVGTERLLKPSDLNCRVNLRGEIPHWDVLSNNSSS